MLHTVDLKQLTITNESTCKILSLVGGWDVLRGFKTDLSLEKLKLSRCQFEAELGKIVFCSVHVLLNNVNNFAFDIEAQL